jgi:hypothetical protein
MTRVFLCFSAPPYIGRHTGWVIWKSDSFVAVIRSTAWEASSWIGTVRGDKTSHFSTATYTAFGPPASVCRFLFQILEQKPDAPLSAWLSFSS